MKMNAALGRTAERRAAEYLGVSLRSMNPSLMKLAGLLHQVEGLNAAWGLHDMTAYARFKTATHAWSENVEAPVGLGDWAGGLNSGFRLAGSDPSLDAMVLADMADARRIEFDPVYISARPKSLEQFQSDSDAARSGSFDVEPPAWGSTDHLFAVASSAPARAAEEQVAHAIEAQGRYTDPRFWDGKGVSTWVAGWNAASMQLGAAGLRGYALVRELFHVTEGGMEAAEEARAGANHLSGAVADDLVDYSRETGVHPEDTMVFGTVGMTFLTTLAGEVVGTYLAAADDIAKRPIAGLRPHTTHAARLWPAARTPSSS